MDSKTLAFEGVDDTYGSGALALRELSVLNDAADDVQRCVLSHYDVPDVEWQAS